MTAAQSPEKDAQDRDVLADILREHQAVANGLGEWACKCSPMEWRPSAYRSRHMAEALILSGRVQVIPPGQQHIRERCPLCHRPDDHHPHNGCPGRCAHALPSEGSASE